MLCFRVEKQGDNVKAGAGQTCSACCFVAHQHSPEEVRFIGGIDAYNVPISSVVLPCADHINAQHTVY